jgi:SLT domain-containing protein
MAAALRYAGVEPTPELVNLGLRRMAQESGGNNAIDQQIHDVNSARGDPAKGLMQNIGSAFPERARELAGRGIYDGFANIVASIRYTLGRYGSLQKGWGRPGGY